MNLIENEEYIKKKAKTRKIMVVLILFIIILLIVSAILLYMIYEINRQTLKLSVDNANVNNFASDLFIMENDNLYVDIKAFAQLMGYETYNGDYKAKYSEDTTNCYISSADEIASFSLNSNTIYKKAVVNEDYEYFELEQPVRLINNKLYVLEEGIEIGTNSAIQYNQAENQITVLSLNYITNYYATNMTNSAVVDEEVNFNNKKALLHNLVVVLNPEGYYGVYGANGQEIIGTKYTDLVYKEDSNEFTVTTAEGSMGILAADGTTKIEPNYSEIKKISNDLNYYLVSNNDNYGVINQNDNTVIFIEYDQIGIDQDNFLKNEIENPYILFDTCIPVMQNEKWGLYDINGNIILPIEYDEIGCTVGSESTANTNNAAIIPQYEAIVVGKQGEDEMQYGIVNIEGEEYVPIMLDSVYSITSSGEEIYSMEFTLQTQENGEIVETKFKYDIDQYFQEHIIETPQVPQIDQNVIVNETTDLNIINEGTQANTMTNNAT